MNITTVNFRGDELCVIEKEGKAYVAMKPITEALGLDWRGQRQRILRDAALSKGVCIITTPSAGGPQDTLCLPLAKLPGWLFGIDSNRVKPEIRDKVIRYREECYEALDAHFRGIQQKPMSQAEMMLAQLQQQIALEKKQQEQEREIVAIKQEQAALAEKVENVSEIKLFKTKPSNTESITEIRQRINQRHGLPVWTINEVLSSLPYSPSPAGQVPHTHEKANGSHYTVWYKAEVTRLFERFTKECDRVSKTKSHHPSIDKQFKLI